ncbi:hypothetical protein [Bradyrhizobium cosmicum]|uniref:hypothetical protein n=1 Tax=Bradyrhizobium cosmicum TaxID=1404864 RepID=UPI0011625217|nr:hypothetical protein [Bradyrhizobium cosmicum]QDP20636.1 hypothetical protein FNV92_00040 [Bradyrhizobium cosmicum]QDP20687.1 hypothetical protein FNV92_00315 [Bradyrhizobium cosmicum]
MITISTNVAVGAGSIIAAAGFLLGYAIAWRQRGNYDARSLAEVMQSAPAALLPCDMPLTADELERLRFFRLMNPTEMHP